MNFSYCILRDGELIPATPLEWERWWFEDATERIIAESQIGDAEISTVCLGMMPPGSFFKTVVFGGTLNGETESYLTLEEAMIGHERMFGRVENEQKLCS